MQCCMPRRMLARCSSSVSGDVHSPTARNPKSCSVGLFIERAVSASASSPPSVTMVRLLLKWSNTTMSLYIIYNMSGASFSS